MHDIQHYSFFKKLLYYYIYKHLYINSLHSYK